MVFLTVASFLTILAKPFSFSQLPMKLDFKILLAFSCRCISVYYLFYLVSYWGGGGDFFSICDYMKAIRNLSIKAHCSIGYAEMNSEFQNISTEIFFICRYFTQHFSINYRTLEH